MSILDLLFPKKCVGCRKMGAYLCPNCFSQLSYDVGLKCLVCERPSWNGMTHPKCTGKYTIDGYFAAIAYKKIAKKLLYQFKYKPYLSDLRNILTDLLYESLVQNELFMDALEAKPVLIPIPLTKKRLRERGYNQAELLAKDIGKQFGLQVQNILKRVKDTMPQYGLKRAERMENMKGAFQIQSQVVSRQSHPSSWPSPTRGEGNRGSVFLVDDVLTTGSTLKEAANVLKRNGFEKVWGVVLAQD